VYRVSTAQRVLAGAADSDGDDYGGGGGYGWDSADLDPGNEAADLIEAPHLVGKLVINYSRASKQVRSSGGHHVSQCSRWVLRWRGLADTFLLFPARFPTGLHATLVLLLYFRALLGCKGLYVRIRWMCGR